MSRTYLSLAIAAAFGVVLFLMMLSYGRDVRLPNPPRRNGPSRNQLDRAARHLRNAPKPAGTKLARMAEERMLTRRGRK